MQVVVAAEPTVPLMAAKTVLEVQAAVKRAVLVLVLLVQAVAVVVRQAMVVVQAAVQVVQE